MSQPEKQQIPFNEFCMSHPEESVKFMCRSPECMIGICTECIIYHSGHDFVKANELASLEVKKIVK